MIDRGYATRPIEECWRVMLEAAPSLSHSSTVSPAQCQQEPVAWRWKLRGTEDWVVCDKLPEFEDDADVICEPLFTCADTSTDREGK